MEAGTHLENKSLSRRGLQSSSKNSGYVLATAEVSAQLSVVGISSKQCATRCAEHHLQMLGKMCRAPSQMLGKTIVGLLLR